MSTPTSPSLTIQEEGLGDWKRDSTEALWWWKAGLDGGPEAGPGSISGGRADGRLAPAGQEASYVQDKTVGRSRRQQSGRLTLLPSRASCGKALLRSFIAD